MEHNFHPSLGFGNNESMNPMLDRYVGKCTVSIINISIGLKEPTHEYQNRSSI
jgi:hypothetical protein